MDTQVLISNLSNPTLLFFVLGMLAVRIHSDLSIPESSAKFISLYLLFSIGFKGGQELAHSSFNAEIGWSLLFGIAVAAVIPVYTFYLLKKRLPIADAGAIAASYGSVSAVTFVAATTFLEYRSMAYGGHMVAVMALMESPAIVAGVLLIRLYDRQGGQQLKIGPVVKHAFTNGSVLLIMGSLVIGLVADTRQAEGIKPFTTDIFKGFLALFLLEMGMVTARNLSAFRKYGGFVSMVALLLPLVNGCLVAWASGMVTHDVANRFIFAILAASASYIAVPAAMRLAVPQADPGLYIPMSLAVTFPFNITLGMPVYFWICS